jgi:hypothetical protein
MPVNLNALIRYKTIDKCLRNTAALSSIDFLIESCSQALYDATGREGSVSERTIRNDIRILRSDILGFNAPIVVGDGVYRYEDSDFSIFESSFNETELLIEIQQLLVAEFHNISNKNLPVLLSKLCYITKVSVSKEFLPQLVDDSYPRVFEKRVWCHNDYATLLNDYLQKQNKKSPFWKKSKPISLKWEFVLGVLNP